MGYKIHREAGYVLALRLYIREFEGKVIQQDQQLGDIVFEVMMLVD